MHIGKDSPDMTTTNVQITPVFTVDKNQRTEPGLIISCSRKQQETVNDSVRSATAGYSRKYAAAYDQIFGGSKN